MISTCLLRVEEGGGSAPCGTWRINGLHHYSHKFFFQCPHTGEGLINDDRRSARQVRPKGTVPREQFITRVCMETYSNLHIVQHRKPAFMIRYGTVVRYWYESVPIADSYRTVFVLRTLCKVPILWSIGTRQYFARAVLDKEKLRKIIFNYIKLIGKFVGRFYPVLRILDILVQFQIRGSGSGFCYFRH